MKNELKMPNVKTVKGHELDLVKLAFKLLKSGASIHDNVTEKTVNATIKGKEFTLSITSRIPKTTADILHYGWVTFSALITDASGQRMQYHSDIDKATATCLGRLIEDAVVINRESKVSVSHDKLEAFLKD